ncbi:MAG: M23 family metallopeptidase [bacterium]|nr:M23 family metallopeptidase [bacterium]
MIKKGTPPADSASDHYSLIWLPPNHAEPHTITMSIAAWRWIRLGLLLLILLAMIILVTWGVSLRRAIQYDSLAAENEKLKSSLRTVEKLRAQMEDLLILDQQIRRAIGGAPALNEEDRAILKDRFRKKQMERELTTTVDVLDLTAIPRVLPVNGMISRGFQKDPFAGNYGHRAVDIAVPEGTPILASASGTVLFSGWTYRYGKMMIIGHRTGYFTMYAHCQVLFFETGDVVNQGEPIALSGNTGLSSAPHLHFEVWKNEQILDPFKVLVHYQKK